jgi:GNAT superfamily N-acetyltransferase
MSGDKYTEDDVYFATLGGCITLDQFVTLVQHVATLNETEDQEEPIAYLGWMFQHGLGYTYDQGTLLAKLLLGFQTGSSTIPNRDLAAGVLNGWAPKGRPRNYLPPHQIYLAFDRQTEELLDIAGFVPDDRDVGQMQRLPEKDSRWIGFFGGHNVRRDKRGQGIGPLMIAHRIEQIQRYVNSARIEAAVYSFLTNGISANLLIERGGFEYLGSWYIKFFEKEEEVFRRVFVPQQ